MAHCRRVGPEPVTLTGWTSPGEVPEPAPEPAVIQNKSDCRSGSGWRRSPLSIGSLLSSGRDVLSIAPLPSPQRLTFVQCFSVYKALPHPLFLKVVNKATVLCESWEAVINFSWGNHRTLHKERPIGGLAQRKYQLEGLCILPLLSLYKRNRSERGHWPIASIGLIYHPACFSDPVYI